MRSLTSSFGPGTRIMSSLQVYDLFLMKCTNIYIFAGFKIVCPALREVRASMGFDWAPNTYHAIIGERKMDI